MLNVTLAPQSQDNYPGNLSEVFEGDGIVGWIHWEGPTDTVIPEKLFDIIEEIKSTPQIVPSFAPNTKFSLAVITGTNDSARFQVLGGATIKIQRGEKVISLSQNAVGKILTTDIVSFGATQAPPAEGHVLSHAEGIEKVDTTVPEMFPQPKFPFKLSSPRDIFLKNWSRETLGSKISSLTSGPTRKPLYLSLVVLVIFISLVLYQLRSRVHENNLAVVKSLESESVSQIESSKSLSEVNYLLAKSQLQESKNQTIKKIEEVFGPSWRSGNDPLAQRLKKVVESLDNQLKSLSRINEVGELSLFYDTNIIKSDFSIDSAALHESTLVFLDKDLGTLISLDTNKKSAKIIGGDDKFKNGIFVDFSTFEEEVDSVFVFTPDKITSTKKASIDKSDDWGNIKALKSYAGNIYLLDSERNTVWKHTATTSGFTSPKSYLAQDISVDLSKAVDLAIDGDVYALTGSGNVAKFTGGAPQNFSLSGLDLALSDPVSIYTSDTTENIYIYDKGNNRVVMFDKKGNYLSQYVLPAESGKRLGDFVLTNEKIKKIFLFEGSKVYGIDIK